MGKKPPPRGEGREEAINLLARRALQILSERYKAGGGVKSQARSMKKTERDEVGYKLSHAP